MQSRKDKKKRSTKTKLVYNKLIRDLLVLGNERTKIKIEQNENCGCKPPKFTANPQ